MAYHIKYLINQKDNTSLTSVGNKEQLTTICEKLSEVFNKLGFETTNTTFVIDNSKWYSSSYSVSGYNHDLKYNNIQIGNIMSPTPRTGDIPSKFFVEFIIGKGPDNMLYIITRSWGSNQVSPEEETAVAATYCVLNASTNIRPAYKFFNSSSTDLNPLGFSPEFFRAVSKGLDLETTEGVLMSNHFDRYGLWEEVFRSNVQAKLFSKYTIDSEEYICIGGDDGNTYGAIFAKLTTEAASV